MERVGRIVVGHTRNGGPDGVKCASCHTRTQASSPRCHLGLPWTQQRPNPILRPDYLDPFRETALRSCHYHLFLDLEKSRQDQHGEVCHYYRRYKFSCTPTPALPCSSTHKTGFRFTRTYAYVNLYPFSNQATVHQVQSREQHL
jgi:hypothetical protein